MANRLEARQQAYARLLPVIGDEAAFEAEQIVKLAVEDQASLLLTANEPLTDAQLGQFSYLLAERCARKPLSRIQGRRHFWNDAFYINEHVLDPRADSEVLVEQALARLPVDADASVLDLGTGSGCLLLSVLGERPRCSGLGVDYSFDALKVATRNADALNLSNRAEFVQGSWADDVQQKFDVVLCNPPYIDVVDKSWMSPEVLNHDPHQALFADDKGLADYQLIFSQLPSVLKSSGVGIFEHGFRQRDALVALAGACGLKVVDCLDDLGGNPRCLILGNL